MEELVEVTQVGMTKLGNGLHANHHRSAYDLINECEAAKIGITDALKTEWNENIDTEEEIGRESAADILTQTMNKKDEERDKLVSFIFMMIRGYRLSPETAEAEAAERLQLVVNPYKKLQRESFSDETAHIVGLLKDLKKTENASLVAALRLNTAVTKLEAANAEFHTLSLQFFKSPRRKDLPTASEVRPKTDAVYERIIFMIRAAYLSGASPVDKAVIKTLVRNLNNLADKTETTYRQSQAQKKANKKPKDPKQPKDPKEPKPKDPKDPKKPEGGGDDIHIPEEPPKKPDDAEQPQPGPGGSTGGGDDIQIPSEPPKKPDGQ